MKTETEKMMRLGIWFGFGVALVSPGFAAPLSPAQTQSGMNAAASQAAKAADTALNAQYKATSARRSAPARARLVSAQRSWIAFRDQEGRFETAGVAGGSAFPLVQAACLKTLTVDRTRQLRALSQCEEGDLSCPR